jgi:rod shape-determining protein MreD
MFKKITQVIFFIIIVSLAALAQFSFISALPSFWRHFNLPLILLVFFLFFSGGRAAFGAALIAGFWLDILFFNFFGLQIISLFMTAWLAQRLASTWLTNRSLYSFLLLILAATLVYNFLTAFGLFLTAPDGARFFLVKESFWRGLAYQSAWSILVALLAFNLISALTRRFRPVFLEKGLGL